MLARNKVLLLEFFEKSVGYLIFLYLGGKIVLPLVTQSVPAMLASPDWKQRHAALMALSAIGEGCHKQMEGMLPQIMNGVPGVMEGVLRYVHLICLN